MNRKAAGKPAKKPARRVGKRKSESEEKFAVIFDKATLAMALSRLPDGELVDVNEEWVKLFGFTKKQAVGKTSVDLGINRDSKRRAWIFREIQKRRFLRQEAAQFFNQRGEARLIDCNMKCVRLGAQSYLLSTMHDVTEQKRAEQALRASEERFRRYFEVGLVGMAITSPGKGILEVNDELCRILDYERDELLQKTWAEITHPDDVAADVANFERVMAGEIEGYSLDKRWIGKNGRIVHSIMAARCSRRPDGSVDYFIGLLQDITERKRAEEKLQRSEIYLAEAQRLSHTGSGAWNVVTGELFWSDETYRIYGFEPGSVSPSPEIFFGIVHPEDRAWLQDEFTIVVAEQRAYDLLFRIVRPDGVARWIHSIGQPRLNQAGEVVEVLGTVMDITERKEAEEKLRESERRFRLLAETLPQHVWRYNPDGRVNYFNRRWLDYSGITWDEARRTGGHEIVHPDDVPRIQTVWREVAAQRKPFEMELRLRRKDGEYRRFLIQGAPFFSDAGELTEWHGTNTDIEDRQQAEEALQQAQAELTRVTRMTAMAEMAAAIAHEINQPLGAIVNNSNYCLELIGKPNTEEKKGAALADIMSDANRASAIIKRVRALADSAIHDVSPLDLRSIIADVIAFALPALTRHRIQVKMRVAKELPQVHADRIQLQQVLLNLVMNAVEAMSGVEEPARVLNLSARRSTLDDKPAVLIAVADNGAGFEAEIADRMFEAFFTTKPHGMGMGLRISRSVVEGYGGRLSAKRNSGKGATFSCVLPITNGAV